MPDEKISSEEMALLFNPDTPQKLQVQQDSPTEGAVRIPAERIEKSQASTRISDDEMGALFPAETSRKPASGARERGKAPQPIRLRDSAVIDSVQPTRVYVKPHDWGEKKRLSGEQIRTLHDIHDQFANSYGPELSIPMKKQIEIKLLGEPEQISYGNFIDSLPSRTSLNRFILPPLEGTAALQIDLKFAFSIVDRLLGGTGDPVDLDERRALTQIEERVLQRALRSLLDNLGNSWKRICQIQPTFTTPESVPRYLQLAQILDDIVIVARFTVKMSDEFGPILDSSMSICYPYILLQPIVSNLRISQLFSSAGVTGSSREIRSTLDTVKVPIYCNLVRDTLRIQDLLEMEKGDVVTFRTRLDQAAEVIIGKTSIFWGRPGAVGRRYAIRIESFIDPEEYAPLRLETAEEAESSRMETEVKPATDSSTVPALTTGAAPPGDVDAGITPEDSTDGTMDFLKAEKTSTLPPIRSLPIKL